VCPLFTKKYKFSAEKKLTKKGTRDMEQGTRKFKDESKTATGSKQHATSRHATKKKAAGKKDKRQTATSKKAKKGEWMKGRMDERKKAASNTQQATGRHATKKKAAGKKDKRQTATNKKAIKTKPFACEVWA
jgi:hypothetical protein